MDGHTVMVDQPSAVAAWERAAGVKYDAATKARIDEALRRLRDDELARADVAAKLAAQRDRAPRVPRPPRRPRAS